MHGVIFFVPSSRNTDYFKSPKISPFSGLSRQKCLCIHVASYVTCDYDNLLAEGDQRH